MRYIIISLIFATSCFGQLRADLNGDHRVDFADLSILASEWMCEEPMADSYLKFNGVDQYVTVADNAALNFGTGDFSISFWYYKTAGGSSYYSILDKLNSVSLVGYRVDYTRTLQSFALRIRDSIDSSYSNITTPTILKTGWVHIAFTVNRTTNLGKSYVDSVISIGVTSITETDTLDITDDLKIGIDNAGTGHRLADSLDDIRIYKGLALNQSQVNAIYNAGKGTKCTDAEIGTGWYSNCDNGTGDVLTGYAVSSGTPSALNGSLTNNIDDNMWEAGGVDGTTQLVTVDSISATEFDEQWVW